MSEEVAPTRFRRLAAELRRRKILESAGLYIAGSWVLIEVAATLFPLFGIPDWAMRVMVIVALVLFPVVMAVSWTFNITLRGFVRTEDIEKPTEFEVPLEELPQRSVAVMPFANLTGDPANDYFGDGMAEELLKLLGRMRDLKVAARTSTFALRDRETDVRRIGGLLGVRHVLEGSVRQAGNRIRITALLIETPTGYHLWSDTFDRDLHDVFAVQDEIAEAITESLKMALDGDAPRERKDSELPTRNIEAYQCVLRANYLWQKRGATAIQGAISALERALALDPGYAEAHSRLAAARAILHEYGDDNLAEAFAVAEAHARRAIELDRGLGEPHAVLGYMALRSWRWNDAETQLQKAIELDPTQPTPHQWYANLLSDFARHEDAMRQVTIARELDPLSPQANNILALTAVWLEQDELALKHVGITREYGMGGVVPDIVELITRLRAGRYDEAVPAWQSAIESMGLGTGWVEPFVAGMADPDRRPAALDALAAADSDGSIDSRQLFFHYTLLGDERAFDAARRRLEIRNLTHAWLFLREAESLLHHPRFRALMETMGVLAYWESHGFPPKVEHLA